MKNNYGISSLIESYFLDWLPEQQKYSRNTILSYRDTFRLLFTFIKESKDIPPNKIKVTDIDAQTITSFLGHVEKDRGNKPLSRNIRLAAIKSFFKYASFKLPEYTEQIQKILAIPRKKWTKKLISYLTRIEMDSILDVPDTVTQIGKRDFVLLSVACETGLRVSELINLKGVNIVNDSFVYIKCIGKGRKERSVPLKRKTGNHLLKWIGNKNVKSGDYVFTNARGEKLSRDGFRYILNKSVEVAKTKMPSLKIKQISPHSLRHSAAMNLLESGVEQTMIALWLGHESIQTTQVYLQANVEIKEKYLAKIYGLKGKLNKYRPDGKLLDFLSKL